MRPSYVGPLHPGSSDTSKGSCRGPVYEPPGTSKTSHRTWLARHREPQTQTRWTSSNRQRRQFYLNQAPFKIHLEGRIRCDHNRNFSDLRPSSYLFLLEQVIPRIFSRTFWVQSTTATSVQLLFPRAHIWRPDSIIPFVFWQRNSSEGETGEGGGGYARLPDQSLPLLIMCSLPCLTSLTPSLPHAKQMSSTADDKLHPNSRSIEFPQSPWKQENHLLCP